MSKTFAFSYLSFNVTARVGDTLEVKMGLRTQTVPLEALRFLYVAPHGDYQELIVAYDKPNGSRGILRAYSNTGDTQFKALVDDLAALKPNADLRAQPRREALKTMGAKDTQLIAMITVPIAITVMMFGAVAPLLIHGLDEGSQKVSAGELGKVKLGSRNLVLSGELDTGRYLEITHTKNGSKTSAEYLIPVYPAGAPNDAFVPVVLETRELGSSSIEQLAQQGEWKCTLRDLLWEGVSSDNRDFMHDELHLNVTKDTKLCELDDGSNLPVLALVGILLCSGLFVSGLIVIAILVQRRKQR